MMLHVQLIGFLAFAGVCLAKDNGTEHQSKNEEWEKFKHNHNKNYSSEVEHSKRKTNFDANHAYVEKHNDEAKQGKHNFTCGINEYSDLSTEEFTKLITGFKMSEKNASMEGGSEESAGSRADLPPSIDWRDKGYVTPVKNQGLCLSCWAYAASGALEGQNFNATGQLVPLSEQNLIDCVPGLSGCRPGDYVLAFQYVQKNGGIDTQAAYPDIQRYSGRCKFQQNSIGGTASGFVMVQPGSESALQLAVATVGPVAIAIQSETVSFQHYQSGIYSNPRCSSTNLDHAVLVVGYGTTNGQDYWIVKNSWGTSWGNKGYIQMSRNNNNNCGVATRAAYPTVSSSASSCKTMNGSECVIPFIYKSITYNGCTTVDDTTNWCSTKNDANGNQVPSYWGYCASTCQSASV